MAYNQHGAADSYYQQGQQDVNMQQQSPPQYGQQQYQNAGQGPYQQPYPPQNQQYPQEPPRFNAQQQGNVNEKVGFEQQFKLDKPKYNDLWAALLFLATFLGFTAVSGLVLYGYSHTKGQQGGGIYNGANTFALNTNTVILL
jgi:hypothetical protein